MSKCYWCGIGKVCTKVVYCQSEEIERHKLCSSCHLNGHACQSSCPLCWHNFAEKYLEKEKLCSGCLCPLIDSPSPIKSDRKKHRLCYSCKECILCSFRRETGKDFFKLTYRDQGTRIQKILYHMQNCVQRIESDYELCSICMEILNGNIKTLEKCRHRFHLSCIEKWFNQKASCPCCRHVYQTHDEPKLKRMRLTSSTTPMGVD